MNKNYKITIKEIEKFLIQILEGNFTPYPLADENIEELKEIILLITKINSMLNESHHFITSLSQGNLDVDPPPRNNLISPFKQLHANLRHLVWQAKQIASGDLNQHVDFLGDFSVAFNLLIEKLKEKKIIEEKIFYLSIHDPLTDLYNRLYFEEEIVRSERGRNFPVSIIIGDLDNLKKVNDTSGHAVGDLLIKDAAEILKMSIRASDVASRIGGDEFAIILPKTDENSVKKTVDRIRKNESKLNSERTMYRVNFSIGYAMANVNESLTDALRKADEMMYSNKAIRKSIYLDS